MNEEKSPRFEEMSWMQRIELLRKISLFPALTVMVFIRRKIGFRIVKPNWLLALAVAMIAVALLLPTYCEPFKSAVIIYALAMWAMGLYQRMQRWQDLGSGVRWHSFSPGVSYLEVLPWPEFFRRHRRINRFCDSALVVIIGLIVGAVISHALGGLLVIGGFFVYVFEQSLYERILNRELDILDGLVAAEVQTDTVKHFQQAQPQQKSRSIEDTAGIPTGLAPDIERQVHVRWTEYEAAQAEIARKASGPDNLVKE